MYEKIKDDWNEIGEIGGKACDIAASKSHVIIATDKGIYSRGKNDYGLGSIYDFNHFQVTWRTSERPLSEN